VATGRRFKPCTAHHPKSGRRGDKSQVRTLHRACLLIEGTNCDGTISPATCSRSARNCAQLWRFMPATHFARSPDSKIPSTSCQELVEDESGKVLLHLLISVLAECRDSQQPLISALALARFVWHQRKRSSPSHVERTGSRVLGSIRSTSSNVYLARPKLQGAQVITMLSKLLSPPLECGSR
jgi:hypothetical protein